MQVEEEITLKFVLLGNYSVGKTAFLSKYTQNSFNEQYQPTVGVDFQIKRMNFKEKPIKLVIWDTAGQERFQTITSSYFEKANSFFIIYDVTNRESFNHVQNCLEQIEKKKTQDGLRILVGNKSDLNNQRDVTVEEGQKFANDSGMLFIEISAKEGFNVEHAFNIVITESLAELEKQIKPEQQ